MNQHAAILGKTGSGKTYCAKGIVESLLDDHRQVCVLDPTGAWYGLRIGADGKTPGYDVVLLGGEHADIPLSPKSGAAVARLVTQQGASVVIDTSGLTVGEYTRWFIDFAGTLYTTIANPLHLIIDEAHNFMPQSGGGAKLDADSAKMLHAGNRLMSGGRSKGVRAMMITQRPAKLHKDSLTCADTLVALRVIAPQDRKAIQEWIDGCGDPAQGRAVTDSLAQLKRGEGWVWYPEGGHLSRVTFPKIKTYDSSATPTHGAKSGPRVAEIKLDEVREAMAEAVKEAEANDPKVLRARVAELERAAAVVPTPTEDPGLREQLAETDRQRFAAETSREFWREEATTLRSILRSAAANVSGCAGAWSEEIAKSETREAANGGDRAAAIAPRIDTSRGTIRKVIDNIRQIQALPSQGLTAPQQAILDTVLMLGDRGITASRDSIARWLDIHPNGGSYGTNLGYLRSHGYLSGCELTEAGRAAANRQDISMAAALAALPDNPKREIIRTLVSHHKPMSRDELANALGIHPNGGSFGTNLGRLRTMGLITERGPIAVTKGLGA